MSHEITSQDKLGLNRTGGTAWHGMGKMLDDGLTAVEFGEQTDMFDPITGEPLFYKDGKGELVEIKSHRCNVRRTADEEIVLGIVGSDYSICQDRELAEFTDAMGQTGKVVVESAGTIRGGKRVWFLARGESFNVGGIDKVTPYILVSNAHDGTQAIRITPTTVRVVCSNTLHMVVPDGEHWTNRPESAAYVIRHQGNIKDKLEQAKKSLLHYESTLRRNRELFDALQAQKFDQEQGFKLFADVYAANWEVATPDDLASPDSRIRHIAEGRVERMRKASEAFLGRYKAEREALQLGDTAWGFFNAMTGYLQHDKGSRGKDDAERVASRVESNLFGVNANRTHEVLAHTLALV